MKKQASILVGLLWCVAVLAVIVVGVLHTARLDLRVVKNYGDQVQAHYLALAGIEKAKALLYEDARSRRRAGQNHGDSLYDAPRHFRDVELGPGHFRVLRQGRIEEGGEIVYGVSDMESRVNVNHVQAGELGRLAGMSPEVAAAIVDWRDEDDSVTQGGAEADYYVSLKSPCLPRNGPLLTVRELLMVAGVSPELLLGEDVNQNGLLDAGEDDGAASFPLDDRDRILDAGWSGVLTVHSSVRNVTPQGDSPVHLQTATEDTLAAVPGISPELAKAIVAHRGKKKLEGLADLFDVEEVVQEDQAAPPGPDRPGPGVSAPVPGPSTPAAPASTPPGRKLVDERVLKQIAGWVTTIDGFERPGVINVNTASGTVLACLPGIDRELAEAIVFYRRASGFFPNSAWLLDVPGITREIFKQVVSRVTCRSETYRILSEGRVSSTGARKRIEVIVHVGETEIKTLSYRDYM
jgi:DNA uptake protein ComE-like DNA-binding protein